MKAEAAIYAMLNASSAVTAIVGQRVYLDTRPEADPLPAIVYSLISEKQDNSRIGDIETVMTRIQVNCLGNTADALVSLRESVRLACHNQSGTFGGTQVIYSLMDGAGPDTYDELVNIYVKTIDFFIHFQR